MTPEREQLLRLHAENEELRERVAAAERSTAQTLARATRLNQVVSVLGRESRLDAIVTGASREVAELFSADIGLLLLGPDDALRVEGTWGLREHDLPAGPFALPDLQDLDEETPVATGSAGARPTPAWLDPYAPRHVAWVRLLVGRQSLGVLMLARRAPVAFEPADEHELRAIGYRIALALENGILHDQMRRQLTQLGRMHDLTTRLSTELDLETVGRQVADMVVAEIPADGCHVQVLREGKPLSLAREGLEIAAGGNAGAEIHTLLTSGRVVGSITVAGGPEEGTDGQELLRHVVGIAALALDKALLFERSREQARLDSLTGLLGHRVFQEEMARRVRGKEPFTVLRLDIDDFKQVNDLCGHSVGDDALRLVALALRETAREGDAIFRVGGEEFCVILPALEASDPAALAVAERMRLRIAEIELPLPITVSIGVAGSPLHSRQRDELLELADLALYSSKRSGKNRTTLAGGHGEGDATVDRRSRTSHLSLLHQHDPETVTHCKHVANLAITVARLLGLDDERLDDLRVAAQLHDIGKVGVPDAILSKPSGLTDDEFRIVKTHPAVGAQLMRSWGLERPARFVGEHHERIDGTGYPEGLAGEEIALESRIIHAVDAYVAMTHDRPYRAAMTVDQAVAELERHSGTQFDPAVVAALTSAAGPMQSPKRVSPPPGAGSRVPA